MDTVTRDMEQLFHHGVQVDGATFYPVLIGAKGDAPALVKLFKLSCSFTRWQGQKGVCMYCLAGQQGLPWEDLTKTAAWRATQYTTTLQGHGLVSTRPALQLCRFQLLQRDALGQT